MTQYGDNRCLDCEHNRKCYMRSIRAHECGVEFVCKKEEDKKIEHLKLNNSDVWTGKTDTNLIVDKINEVIDYINKENK